jgi:chromosome partitioning protein
MKTIVIANRKGGVGKTTASFNLCHKLALEGNKVIGLDLDTQCNLTTQFQCDHNMLDEFKSLRIQKVNENIDILAGTKAFSQLESEINLEFDRNTYLLTTIKDQVKDKGYDYMVIDTSPSISIININALCMADIAVVVVNPDNLSIEGFVEIKDMILKIKKSVNNKLAYTILLNAYYKGRTLSDAVTEQLSKDPMWRELKIPDRQYITNCNVQKKHILDENELDHVFSRTVKAIKEIVGEAK